jgi:hypothetical protein
VIAWLRSIFLDHLALKGIALTLSVVVFLVSHGQREGEVSLKLPLQLTVPEGFVLQGEAPSIAHVQLQGRRDLLQVLQTRGLKPLRVVVDARDGVQQLSLVLPKEDLPSEVDVVGMEPERLFVTLDPIVSASLPVITRHRLRGELADGLRLGAVRSDPPQVMVSGPRTHIERLKDLSPAMVDLTNRRATFSEPRALSIPPGLGLSVEPTEVMVHVEILARSQSLRVSGVRVRALNLPRPHELAPDKVDLVLLGTPDALALVNTDQLFIAFDAEAELDAPPRDTPHRVLPEHILNLPEGVILDDARLPTVLLRTLPIPEPPAPIPTPPAQVPPPPDPDPSANPDPDPSANPDPDPSANPDPEPEPEHD